MLKRILIPLTAALLTFGCAGNRKVSVKDTEVARLPQDASQQWQQQQLALIQANDETARAEIAVNDAKRDREVAKSDVKIADAEIDRAKKALEAAEKARDDAAATQARSDLSFSQQKKQVAELHVEANDQQVELTETGHDLAQARQELAELDLNKAKYEALKAADDPAAANYDPAKFAEATSQKQNDISRLENEVELKRDAYARARQTWETKQQQLEAATPGTPAG